MKKLLVVGITHACVCILSQKGIAQITNTFLVGPVAGPAADEVLNTPNNLVLTSTPVGFDAIDINGGKRLGSNPTASTATDAYDFFISASNTIVVPPSAALQTNHGIVSQTILNPNGPDSRILHRHNYTNTHTNTYLDNPPTQPRTNNMGTAIVNTVRIDFGPHLTVTDIVLRFNSLNTAGVTWEYSYIYLLDQFGNPFTPPSAFSSWSLGAHSQYGVGPTAGFTGNAGPGLFVAGSKGTVNNVNTANTTSGTSGPADIASFSIDYSATGFNLPAGTIITGLIYATVLEDVRGTGNGTSNLTSSLADFTITYTIIPEPTSILVTTMLGLLIILSGRWRKIRQFPANKFRYH